MYADYEFYTDEFFGVAISYDDFPRLSSRASDFLDYYTRGKAAKVPESDTVTLLALAKACCAVAEQMQIDDRNKEIAAMVSASALASGTGEIKSETVGSHSVSYATSADYGRGSAANALRDARAAYADIASVYLVNTGLLYRGGC